MMPNLAFNESELLAFILVLLRVSAFVVSWPIFSVYSVPNLLKILFALALAMIIFPVVDRSGIAGRAFDGEIAWLAGKEILTGLCLGFLTRLFFFAVGVGGNLIATSSGMANAQIFNPTMNATTTTVEQFYVAVATLLFLGLNGHHIFLTGLVESFHAIPLSISGANLASLGDKARDSGLILKEVTESGIKISAPVMVTVFIMNVAMGIVGRAVPQINVLITSMSVNFMAGLLLMMVSIPALVYELNHEISSFSDMLFRLMKTF